MVKRINNFRITCIIFPFSLFLSLFLCFLNAADVCASYRPDWIQEYLDGTLKMENEYHGISFASFKGESPDYDTMRLAKDRALDELCYQFSVSVRSKFEDNMEKKGDYEEQHIVSSLFVSTRKVLSGVQERKKWIDPKKQSFWVLLAIDKKSADRQLEQQAFINEVVDRLEHKQEEILEGIKLITSMLASNMKIYEERMNRLEGLLQTIDTKVGSTNEQIKEEYAAIRQEIIHMNEGRKEYEESLAQSQSRQAEQIKGLMLQNNELKDLLSRISNKIEKDYFLALANDDLEYKAINPDFSVNIRPDKGQGADYLKGEKVRFLIQASRGCYIKVIYISSVDKDSGKEKKTNILLFPNEYDRNNWINAGEKKVIGSHGEIEVQEPFGKDIVTVVASTRQFTDLDSLLNKTRGGYYSEDTSNTRGALTLRTRGLAVVRPETSTSDTPADKQSQMVPMATDTCFIVSHPK